MQVCCAAALSLVLLLRARLSSLQSLRFVFGCFGVGYCPDIIGEEYEVVVSELRNLVGMLMTLGLSAVATAFTIASSSSSGMMSYGISGSQYLW